MKSLSVMHIDCLSFLPWRKLTITSLSSGKKIKNILFTMDNQIWKIWSLIWSQSPATIVGSLQCRKFVNYKIEANFIFFLSPCNRGSHNPLQNAIFSEVEYVASWNWSSAVSGTTNVRGSGCTLLLLQGWRNSLGLHFVGENFTSVLWSFTCRPQYYLILSSFCRLDGPLLIPPKLNTSTNHLSLATNSQRLRNVPKCGVTTPPSKKAPHWFPFPHFCFPTSKKIAFSKDLWLPLMSQIPSSLASHFSFPWYNLLNCTIL